MLCATSAALHILALRGDPGEALWRFDPFAGRRRGSRVNGGVTCREAGTDRRVFVPRGAACTRSTRAPGRPLFPVEERPVPPSDVPGERAWPAHPVATSLA